jgi:cytidine deaminase
MNKIWETDLILNAWHAREKAIARKTKVGCAIIGKSGNVHTGCNIEHDFGTVFHAEEVALMKALSIGDKGFHHILVVAEMRNFNPCGRCLDWIKQFSHEEVVIGFQSRQEQVITWRRFTELMPLYPQK